MNVSKKGHRSHKGNDQLRLAAPMPPPDFCDSKNSNRQKKKRSVPRLTPAIYPENDSSSSEESEPSEPQIPGAIHSGIHAQDQDGGETTSQTIITSLDSQANQQDLETGTIQGLCTARPIEAVLATDENYEALQAENERLAQLNRELQDAPVVMAEVLHEPEQLVEDNTSNNVGESFPKLKIKNKKRHHYYLALLFLLMVTAVAIGLGLTMGPNITPLSPTTMPNTSTNPTYSPTTSTTKDEEIYDFPTAPPTPSEPNIPQSPSNPPTLDEAFLTDLADPTEFLDLARTSKPHCKA